MQQVGSLPSTNVPASAYVCSRPSHYRPVRATMRQNCSLDHLPFPRRLLSFIGTSVVGILLSDSPATGQELQRSLLADALSAPLEFLKSRQRANNGEKLLAPIRAARRRLQLVEGLLTGINPEDSEAYRQILEIVRVSSLNCYQFEPLEGDSLETRASLVAAQIKLGDPCTYRLIGKNVTNLLTPKYADLKAETLDNLERLIRSFQLLDDVVDRAWYGDTVAASRVSEVLDTTVGNLDNFQDTIEECLGFPRSHGDRLG
eukprot:jgi/Botrbrau1/980/Bobra.114_1s0021.1